MAANEQEKILKDAQYRKGLGIGFFNATNSAIALVAAQISTLKDTHYDDETLIARVAKIRDIFIEQHKNYYATVIANVGVNYKPEDSIAKLRRATNKEELNIEWRLLSADERKNAEIIKVAQELNKQYKNEKA